MTGIAIRHAEAADAEAAREILQSSPVGRSTTRLPLQAPEKLAGRSACDPAMLKLVAVIEERVAPTPSCTSIPTGNATGMRARST